VCEDLDELRSDEGELVYQVGRRFQNVVQHVYNVLARRFGFCVGGTAAGRDMRDVNGVDISGRAC